MEEKIKKFEERMVNFQIEIKTVEKCMREDITGIETYKLDKVNILNLSSEFPKIFTTFVQFKGEKMQNEMEEIKKLFLTNKINTKNQVDEMQKVVDEELKDRSAYESKQFKLSLILFSLEINKKQVKELASRVNLFETRLEGIFKITNTEGPVHRHEIDQERLRYLGMGPFTNCL